jgi:hypothetical protein
MINKMKKVVFFTVLAFISQMFCENAFSQDWTQNYNNYIFKINSEEYMRISRGAAYDLQMYFPHTVSAGGPRWNRIIAQGQLAFFTNNRGLSDNNVDMLINASGNVGIGGLGSDAITEKLTVAGNLRFATGGKIISNSELELNPLNNNPISFNLSGLKGLQMKNGRNNDFTLYFPVSNSINGRWNRIIAKNNLSFTAGDRGVSADVSDLFVSTSGNVGVGFSTPSEKLSVYGNIKIANGKRFTLHNDSLSMDFEISSLWHSKGTNPRNYLGVITNTNHGLLLGANNTSIMKIEPNNEKGYVIIYKDGTGTSPDLIKQENKDKYALFVEDGILSEDFAIGPKKTWADFVFNVDYKLKTLNEVEQFVKDNKHLPDMPAASEVQENGYNLHHMNVKLLQKVEELTLYSIEQEKTIKMLLGKMEQLENKINK